MLASTNSAALAGVDSIPVQVEAHLALGLPGFHVVGLPDAAVQEARERVRVAIASSGYDFPMRRITVNLAPADLRKQGPIFDLPIALAILAAAGHIPAQRLEGHIFAGELALDGSLRSIPGSISFSQMAKSTGARGLVLPRDDAAEAALVPGVKVIGASSLSEVISWLKGDCDESHLAGPAAAIAVEARDSQTYGGSLDFADVKGQALAKRALEIAAAGDHNLILIGPPGSGKTMLARRLPGILPAMSSKESLDVMRICSVARGRGRNSELLRNRPFRSPHHSISAAGLIGGGAHYPKPGEVTLSHNGVLFLDEILEFNRAALEALRQPLEEGCVALSRGLQTVTYPANFTLVAAANPCKCGYLGDRIRTCTCSPGQALEYRARLSGPLADRIDIHVDVPRLRREEQIISPSPLESSEVIRRRVEEARSLMKGRPEQKIQPEVRRFLADAVERLTLSARAFDRVERVARTIAALDQKLVPGLEHVAEALQYRFLDRQLQHEGITRPGVQVGNNN